MTSFQTAAADGHFRRHLAASGGCRGIFELDFLEIYSFPLRENWETIRVNIREQKYVFISSAEARSNALQALLCYTHFGALEIRHSEQKIKSLRLGFNMLV